MYKGQSLLGLMIALSLSVLLLLAMSHFYSRILGAQQQWSARLELQNELQRTIRLIAKELRRSGFRAAPKNTLKSNLALFNLDERQNYVTLADNCLLFFYDRQQDGCVGSPSLEGCVRGKRNIAKNTGEDLIGYRLENKNLQLKTRLESDWDSCSGDRCRDFLDSKSCSSAGRWNNLFDPKKIEINHFSSHWVIENRLLEIRLKGSLRSHPKLVYESAVVVPLLNGDAP
ncbi:MAG: hypothetical protein KH899_00665 [Haemophilus pittmaniae]|jgi:hypothetical protein|uniref:hypothetical protein n=1 Tax=Haemophilus pittmaniae TaxID=249188 RepID=UPI0023F1CDD9|nr:hypothetical protein [Haemophilus pittmaniae]MBS6026111.1 hypothetical protein [Haemophilus pittmaniae]